MARPPLHPPTGWTSIDKGKRVALESGDRRSPWLPSGSVGDAVQASLPPRGATRAARGDVRHGWGGLGLVPTFGGQVKLGRRSRAEVPQSAPTGPGGLQGDESSPLPCAESVSLFRSITGSPRIGPEGQVALSAPRAAIPVGIWGGWVLPFGCSRLKCSAICPRANWHNTQRPSSLFATWFGLTGSCPVANACQGRPCDAFRLPQKKPTSGKAFGDCESGPSKQTVPRPATCDGLCGHTVRSTRRDSPGKGRDGPKAVGGFGHQSVLPKWRS